MSFKNLNLYIMICWEKSSLHAEEIKVIQSQK